MSAEAAETIVMIEDHPCNKEEADGPKSDSNMLSDDTNTLVFHRAAACGIICPDIDFLGPPQYHIRPELPPPRDFLHHAQSELFGDSSEAKVTYKYLSIHPNHPRSSDTDSDLSILFRQSGNQTSTQSRSSHNRNVGYTLHTSTASDYTVCKQQAAKRVADFDLLLDQESQPTLPDLSALSFSSSFSEKVSPEWP